ncbi:hypothetical protein [Agromyces sp. NPDC058104]|uniref:hypothetical protein n=1 Tax=Agromyces sp. NPDC058104 TaxID=3346342 RepID=UPI0036D97236
MTLETLIGRFERAARHKDRPFTQRVAADALTPGIIHPEVLEQQTWWIDILGTPWRIHEPGISTPHLINVLMFLREQSGELQALGEGETASHYYPSPCEWPESTPLFRELQAELEDRSL